MLKERRRKKSTTKLWRGTEFLSFTLAGHYGSVCGQGGGHSARPSRLSCHEVALPRSYIVPLYISRILGDM